MHLASYIINLSEIANFEFFSSSMPWRTIVTAREMSSANLDGNAMRMITSWNTFLIKLILVQSQSVTGVEKAVHMELVKLRSSALVKLAGMFTAKLGMKP